MSVKEMGPLLCSRKYGPNWCYQRKLGWPQCLPLVGSGFEPLCCEEEESGKRKLITMTTTESKKPEVSWVWLQPGQYTGEAGPHPVGHFPQPRVVWRLHGSCVPWCRGPSNCRGCWQCLCSLLRSASRAGSPVTHLLWTKAGHRTALPASQPGHAAALSSLALRSGQHWARLARRLWIPGR